MLFKAAETSELDLEHTLDSNLSLSIDAKQDDKFRSAVKSKADEYERSALSPAPVPGSTPTASR